MLMCCKGSYRNPTHCWSCWCFHQCHLYYRYVRHHTNIHHHHRILVNSVFVNTDLAPVVVSQEDSLGPLGTSGIHPQLVYSPNQVFPPHYKALYSSKGSYGALSESYFHSKLQDQHNTSTLPCMVPHIDLQQDKLGFGIFGNLQQESQSTYRAFYKEPGLNKKMIYCSFCDRIYKTQQKLQCQNQLF